MDENLRLDSINIFCKDIAGIVWNAHDNVKVKIDMNLFGLHANSKRKNSFHIKYADNVIQSGLYAENLIEYKVVTITIKQRSIRCLVEFIPTMFQTYSTTILILLLCEPLREPD